MARAIAGDTAAFERLYRAHVPRILALTRRMAGADRADELTQDVFVRAWQKLALFRGESSLATWLHRMAVNVVIEQFRTLGTARERFLPEGDDVLTRVAAPTVAQQALFGLAIAQGGTGLLCRRCRMGRRRAARLAALGLGGGGRLQAKGDGRQAQPTGRGPATLCGQWQKHRQR